MLYKMLDLFFFIQFMSPKKPENSPKNAKKNAIIIFHLFSNCLISSKANINILRNPNIILNEHSYFRIFSPSFLLTKIR